MRTKILAMTCHFLSSCYNLQYNYNFHVNWRIYYNHLSKEQNDFLIVFFIYEVTYKYAAKVIAVINHWFLHLNCFCYFVFWTPHAGSSLGNMSGIWRLLLSIKTIQYGQHKMDNHLLILLPLLVSAYLHHGESRYVPGSPAAHE